MLALVVLALIMRALVVLTLSVPALLGSSPAWRCGLGAPAPAGGLASVDHLQCRPERIGVASRARRAGALITLGHCTTARRVRPSVADAAEAAAGILVPPIGGPVALVAGPVAPFGGPVAPFGGPVAPVDGR